MTKSYQQASWQEEASDRYRHTPTGKDVTLGAVAKHKNGTPQATQEARYFLGSCFLIMQ